MYPVNHGFIGRSKQFAAPVQAYERQSPSGKLKQSEDIAEVGIHGRKWLRQHSQKLPKDIDIAIKKMPVSVDPHTNSIKWVLQADALLLDGKGGIFTPPSLQKNDQSGSLKGAANSMESGKIRQKIGFFCAVDYGDMAKTRFQNLLEKVDSYFYLGGEKARVISSETGDNSYEVKLVNESPSRMTTALKVASYFTGVLPLIMLVGKAILRAQQSFYIVHTPLTKLQQTIAVKLSKATTKIVCDILKTITASASMSPEQFVEVHVTLQQVALSGVDARTRAFSQKMMEPINEDLKKVPTFAHSMQLLAASLDDSQIQQKLVETIALPTIQQLVQDLDSIKASIIDDMITS